LVDSLGHHSHWRRCFTLDDASSSTFTGWSKQRLSGYLLHHIHLERWVRGEERIYTTCSICLEDFTIGEEVLVLECTHLVHPDCVKN
jgi:hypothetical protein